LCKFCGKKFVIKFFSGKGSGSGGQNAKKRSFCTDKCKNAYGRRKTENKIKKKCEICGKEFWIFPSQKRRFCSWACKIQEQKRMRVKRIKKQCLSCKKTYQINPNKPSNKNKKFCNRKCQHEYSQVKKKCITCGKDFFVKRSKSHLYKRCSRECQYHDQSNGKIKIKVNGRTGYRKDIKNSPYFKSALEADFVRALDYLDIKYEYENHTFGYKEKKYTPDFYLPEFDMFIELKGVEKGSKPFQKFMRRNVEAYTKTIKRNLLVVSQKEFMLTLRELNLWKKLPVLEIRNYRQNKELVYTYEDQKNQEN
jgi:hypothetical protein